jgi:hypothetical protein
MEIYTGNYKKKNGEVRQTRLYSIKENEKYIEGIDLSKLDEKEQEDFIIFIQGYHKTLDKYIKKAYRSFIKENFENRRTEVIKESE